MGEGNYCKKIEAFGKASIGVERITVINRLIYHNPPEKQNHFVPMDILTRYNADYYRF